MKKIWLPAFIALSALHIIAVAAGIDMLRTCTKPLLMPVLALWLVSETPGIRSSLRTGWLIGLFFSTLGDILLMFPGGLYFLLGLSAFLLAHLSYIGGITTGLRGRRGFLLQNPLWMAPFLLYPVVLLYWLWDGIPAGMRIPVAVYALVISTMAQSVINLRGYLPEKVFQTLMAGAILFVLSDSLIAVDKFGHPFAGAHVAIITTYIVGQWLLAKGIGEVLRK